VIKQTAPIYIRKRKTPRIAAAIGGASFLVQTRLLFNLEQMPNPSEVLLLNGIHSAPIKRKRKTPLRLNNPGDVFKQL
jgi:hypothetical protein